MQKILFILMLGASILALGCSHSGQNPIEPAPHNPEAMETNHCTWGLWQFRADPGEGSLDVVQLRAGNFHLNALTFLEPPPLVYLSLESLQFNGNIIEADIGLRHPFLGLTEFTGFDVCGVLITNGSVTGFNDSDIRLAGEGDTRLLNPDGLTRWWNPSEFPHNVGMGGYVDGLLGTPDSIGDYNSTVNAYKYYCDDIELPDSPLSDVTLQSRGKFGAGMKNVRRFIIELGADGLLFNYAVDASWEFPGGQYPWHAPDDFGPGANKPEAWRIEVAETSNTLWNDGQDSGGGLALNIDVYDWFNAELNMVRLESPGNFTMVESASSTGGGAGFSTYEVEITSAAPDEESINLLISVISEEEDFEGYIPGVNTTAYFSYTAEVASEAPAALKNIPLREGVKPFDIAFDPIDGRLLIIYDDEEVWQYLPGDNYMFPNPDEAFYDTDWHTVDPNYPGKPFEITKAFIDIADNQNAIVLFTWHPGVHTHRAWYDVVNHSGQRISRIEPIGIYFNLSYTNLEALAWGEGSADAAYHNRVGTLWGHSVPYYTFLSYSLESENYLIDHYYNSGNMGWEPPPPYGKSLIYGPWVRGAEVDQDDMHMWALETADYYAARWYNLTYDEAYFGTGAQTDSDDGFNNPMDLTRDVENIFMALDMLSDDTSRIKAFDVTNSTDTIPAESLGGLDLDDIIIGPAIKMDCSDYSHPTHGNTLVVIHGDDTEGYFMSIFCPDELPW